MKLRITVLTFVIILGCNILSAQNVTLSTGTPESAGMDKNILNAGINMFKEAVEKDALRSAVLLVARKGKVVLCVKR